MDKINPKHYDLILDGKKYDYFDIGEAMNLSREQFTALRYLRIKGDKNKQIEDTKKAIKCLQRFIDRLEKQSENLDSGLSC